MSQESLNEGIDTVSEKAMDIIMAAGDARVMCTEALTAVEASDYTLAYEKVAEAEKKIAEAHHIQTDVIQGAIGGEKQEYSLLFAHAQDTLMTIYSEIHMTKKQIKLFEKINERLEKLEKMERNL